MKSRVVVREEAGIELGISFTLGHIARNITRTQVPPKLACTPYHMRAIALRLKTRHKLPKMSNLVRLTTGNVTWNMAPGFKTRKCVTIPDPSQTQIQACHHDTDHGRYDHPSMNDT